MHLLHSHETGNTLCSSFLFNVQNQLKNVTNYLLTEILLEKSFASTGLRTHNHQTRASLPTA